MATRTATDRPEVGVAVPGRSGSSAGYRLLYRLGITPGVKGRIPPEVAEAGEGATGRALDLGCGTGKMAIYLARHGWQVTGVDFVARPLAVARRQAAAAGVAPTWIQGDVTRLPELGVGEGFTLVLDYGCFHGLWDDQRDAYAAGVTEITAPGSTFLLMAFAPGRRGPAPRGSSREEIVRRFGGAWELVSVSQTEGQYLPGPLRNADPTTYRLRRR